MTKCPFCGASNEDGTVFCEACKMDLSNLNENVPVANPFGDAEVEAVAPVFKEVPPQVAVPAGMSAVETMHSNERPEVKPLADKPAHQPVPAGAQPKLVVLRGLRINTEYPIFEGDNYIGRTDEKPVDIDLEDQEPPDRIWSSRQHALISFHDSLLEIEDLGSANGTFVNRSRVYPGQKRPLNVGDVVQIGTVQMKVKV